LSDPENYDVINHVGTKYAKSAQFYDAFGIGYSTFSSASNDLHRIRRSGLNPFFSRKMVLRLEDVVQSKAEKLCELVAKKLSRGESVDLHHGLRAVSVDIFTDYAFGNCYNLLDRLDLGLDFFAMVQGIGPMMWIFFQWPALQKILLSIPPAIAMRMSPPLKQVLDLQAVFNPYYLWRQSTDAYSALPRADIGCKGRYGSWEEVGIETDHLPSAPDL
jgi:hypothetical protein